jgi:hypothetical protein
MLVMFGIVFLITFAFLIDFACSLVVLISVVMTVTNIIGELLTCSGVLPIYLW